MRSGLILDVYDDPKLALEGSVTRENMTDAMKVATALSPADLEALPDKLFALCLYEGDDPAFRKFACVDQGNTELHIVTFLKHAHKLDDELRQKTAENLGVACDWYGVPVPPQLSAEMEKSAILGKLMTLSSVPSLVSGTSQEIKRNLATVRAGEAQAGSTSGGLAAMGQKKLGEASFVGVNGKSTDKTEKVEPTPMKTSMEVVRRSCAPERPVQTEKRAMREAIPGVPLDTYAEVQAAARSFEEKAASMPLAERRVFGLHLVKRANELHLPVGDVALHYGSEKSASDDTWAAAYASRKRVLSQELHADFDKVAAMRDELPTEKFASLLELFDRTTGLVFHYGHRVPDPFLSSYEKLASALEPSTEFEDMSPLGIRVTEHRLKRLASHRFHDLVSYFGEDFAAKFQQNPVSAYKSLPDNRRSALANMQIDNTQGTGGNT